MSAALRLPIRLLAAAALVAGLAGVVPVAQAPGAAPMAAVILDPAKYIQELVRSAGVPVGVSLAQTAPGALATWRGTDGSVASLLWVPLDAREGPSVADLTLTRIDQSARTRGLSPAATGEMQLFGRAAVLREYRRQETAFGGGGEAQLYPEGVAVVADLPSGALVLLAHSKGSSQPAQALATAIARHAVPGLAGVGAADPAGSGEWVVGIRNGRKLALAIMTQTGQPVIWRGIPVQVRQIGPSERPLRPGSGIVVVSDSLDSSLLGRGIDPMPGANRLEVLGPSGILLSGDIVEEPAAMVPRGPARAP